MTMNTQAPEQLYGYEVTDSAGNTLGKVDGVWIDDATNALEFISVKTGRLMGKSHIIPAAHAQVDGGSQTMTVPYAQDQIKDAPSYGIDKELTPDDEQQIYAYYGLDRSTASSPSGLPTSERTGTTGTADTRSGAYSEADTDTRNDDAGTGESETMDTGQDQQRVTLAEEELQVGKRQVEAGQVRIRKVVRTDEVNQPVELRHEEVQIERVPAEGSDVPDTAFQEDTIDVPVMREEAVVSKEARVTGQVRVGKDVRTEQQTVSGDVRKEDVEVEGADGESATRRGDTNRSDDIRR